MKIIEIREDKYTNLIEHIEKALRHAGKAMQMLDAIGGEFGMGERNDGGGGRYAHRDGGGYGDREERERPYYREHDEDDDMGERRRSRTTGRYMR